MAGLSVAAAIFNNFLCVLGSPLGFVVIKRLLQVKLKGKKNASRQKFARRNAMKTFRGGSSVTALLIRHGARACSALGSNL